MCQSLSSVFNGTSFGGFIIRDWELFGLFSTHCGPLSFSQVTSNILYQVIVGILKIRSKLDKHCGLAEKNMVTIHSSTKFDKCLTEFTGRIDYTRLRNTMVQYFFDRKIKFVIYSATYTPSTAHWRQRCGQQTSFFNVQGKSQKYL